MSRKPAARVETSVPIAIIVTPKVTRPPMKGSEDAMRKIPHPQMRLMYSFFVL